jgi:hypothetical protein
VIRWLITAPEADALAGIYLDASEVYAAHAGVASMQDRWAAMLLYRPPRGAEKRLTVNAQGKFVCLLKVPCRDATTRIVFEPLDLIARLPALVPRPRVSLSPNHEVSAPKHRWRAEVTPAGRGRGAWILRAFGLAASRWPRAEGDDRLNRRNPACAVAAGGGRLTGIRQGGAESVLCFR